MATQEIIMTEWHASIFNEAEVLLRTQGHLGQPIFEDTYVLNKQLAQWVMNNSGQGSLAEEARKAYDGVLGNISINLQSDVLPGEGLGTPPVKTTAAGTTQATKAAGRTQTTKDVNTNVEGQSNSQMV